MRTSKAFYLLCIFALILALPTFQFVSRKIKRAKQHHKRAMDESFVYLSDLEKYKAPRKNLGSLPINALTQPYFYLGKGKQAYAFVSADNNYVLKLLKRPKKSTRCKKIKTLITSLALGANAIPRETGILYFHANNKEPITGRIKLLTKKGQVLTLDLSKYFFFVQEKVTPFKEALLRDVSSYNFSKAQASVKSIFTLAREISEKGIADRDGSLIRNQNIGFLGSEPILIDAGKLVQTTKDQALKQNLKNLKPLKRFLEQSFPELLDTYQINSKETIVN